MSTYIHDPDAVLDYAFDWGDWLADGEAVASHVIETSGGITVDSDEEDAGVVTVWISGGSAPETARVTCRVTTDQGRTDDRTISLRVKDR